LLWARAMHKNPTITPESIRALQSHRYISHKKAEKELGYSPRPLEETIRDTFKWFKEVNYDVT